MLKLQNGNFIVAWRRERFVMQREDLLNVNEHDLMLAGYDVASSSLGDTLMIENDSFIWDHFLFEILGEADNIHAIYRGWTIPQVVGEAGVDGYEYTLGHVESGSLVMNDPIPTDFVGNVGKIETTMSLAGMAFVSAIVPGDDYVEGVSTVSDFSHYNINFSSGSLPSSQ